MASVYSGESWTGDYTYTRVRVDYSGTSATAHLLYSRTNNYSGATGSGSATFSFGGASVGFNQTRYGHQEDSELASVSFSISKDGGTYSGSSTGGYMGGSWSVSIPSQRVAPSGLSASIAELYTNGAKFNVSVSSYGDPSSADGRWIEAGITSKNSWANPLRSANALNTSSAQILVNNQSTKTTTLTVAANTQYYYGCYAWNTKKSTSKIQGQLVTLAYAPTLSVGTVGETSVVVNYSTSTDGGKYTKNIQYSLNGGTTWTTGATVSTGSASSGSFTITGLTDDTAYTLKCRTNTTAGNTNGSDITFRTLESHKFYGSVSGVTKKAKKLYGSVNGQTKQIKKLYASVNGRTKRVF